MPKKSFTNLVKDHFGYLISDFGFSISEESAVSEKSWSGGIMVYASGPGKQKAEGMQLLIKIILDRGYVLIDFDSPHVNTRDLIGLTEVMRLVAPDQDLDEKIDFSKRPIEVIEPQIQKLAYILRHYCTSLLQGDLSFLEQVMESRNRGREERIKEWKKRKE